MGHKRRSASSRRWLSEHESDQYVQRARAEGWRSRAVFKLEELDQRDRLLRSGMRIVDLGAAPGGWTQYCVKRCGGRTTVIGIDLLPIDPLPGSVLIQNDFESDEGLAALEAALNGQRVDLVLSDMAPNISGIASADQARATSLVELALDFCDRQLGSGGDFVAKAFQGEGFDPWLAQVRERFEKVSIRKPAASRARSREVYVVARNFRLG
ncbi:MAG: 23S rRNA (uridine(2552)-2'-O)-methyltransferase RlmE [Abyssibacter sp.]|uniref:23S rRNA (uridine(2552)-2'-O)-methyltransferase RlmE n=1 Tax=Abyssibacter sp. TaxID=2320200 RepID=UPI003219B3D2